LIPQASAFAAGDGGTALLQTLTLPTERGETHSRRSEVSLAVLTLSLPREQHCCHKPASSATATMSSYQFNISYDDQHPATPSSPSRRRSTIPPMMPTPNT
jgi:hypothetical protein